MEKIDRRGEAGFWWNFVIIFATHVFFNQAYHNKWARSQLLLRQQESIYQCPIKKLLTPTHLLSGARFGLLDLFLRHIRLVLQV